MKFNPDLLCDYGAVRKNYRKGSFLFQEGGHAFYFFQIVQGIVKMVNAGDAHDFIQGIFCAGESFGEPPMINEKQYPAAAIALTDVEVLALPRKHFVALLRNNFDLHLEFTAALCQRIQYKAQLLRTFNLGDPEERILNVIDLLQKKLPRTQYGMDDYFIVPATRQDLADLTGLRVETVIRKIGQLEEKGEVVVRERKILRLYPRQADAAWAQFSE
jgi:CRP-like cAMP-binding protein